MSRRLSRPGAQFVCLAGLVAASSWAAAQQSRDAALPVASAAGTAVVSGTVVTDEAQARPVRRAILTIAGGGLGVGRETVTDDQGRFTFEGLPGGGYTLSATKAGWITTYYGSRHPGLRAYGTPLTLADGERNTTVVLRLLHGSAITGTILDPAGRPAAAQVRLLQFQISSGQRTLVPAVAHGRGGTDDRGVYRFYGLAPGEYVIAAAVEPQGLTDAGASLHQVTPDVLQSALGAGPAGSERARQGPTVGYAAVYYPGTVDLAAAAMVPVGPDEEKTGIDFSLSLVPTASIHGVVESPDGPLPTGTRLWLLPQGPLGPVDESAPGPFAPTRLALIPRDGTFTMASVTPGRYSIAIRAANRSAWAEQDVTVNGQDLSGLKLTLQPGMTVSGRVISDIAGPAPFDMTRVAVSLTAVDPRAVGVGAVAPAAVNADGSFRLSGVVPGRYELSVSAPTTARRGGAPGGVSDWHVASAVVSGHDAIDLPFHVAPHENVTDATITLTSALGEISGMLSDAGGHSAHDYVVVVFSADRAYWSTTNRRMPLPTATRGDGTFRVSNLPAGDYVVAVATDWDPDALHDSAALEALAAQAVRVTLGNSEKKVQDLRIAGGHIAFIPTGGCRQRLP